MTGDEEIIKGRRMLDSIPKDTCFLSSQCPFEEEEAARMVFLEGNLTYFDAWLGRR